MVGFRDLAIGIVKESGLRALLFSAIGKLWAYVILVLALRIVGLDAELLSLGQIFVVWVIVLLITSIPITPGGIGIAEVAYIFFFSQMIGNEYSDLIAAGVILFRLVQWFLPIPIGWAASVVAAPDQQGRAPRSLQIAPSNRRNGNRRVGPRGFWRTRAHHGAHMSAKTQSTRLSIQISRGGWQWKAARFPCSARV